MRIRSLLNQNVSKVVLEENRFNKRLFFVGALVEVEGCDRVYIPTIFPSFTRVLKYSGNTVTRVNT